MWSHKGHILFLLPKKTLNDIIDIIGRFSQSRQEIFPANPKTTYSDVWFGGSFPLLKNIMAHIQAFTYPDYKEWCPYASITC